jgi:hypothetical protein
LAPGQDVQLHGHTNCSNQIPNIYPDEAFEYFGLDETIERLGDKFEIILDLHQQFLVKNDLVSKEQFVDFSSTYFEGTKPELGVINASLGMVLW